MEDKAEILEWYIMSGIDAICTDEPKNWLISDKVSESQAKNQASNPRPATTLLAQESAAACVNARDICAGASDLAELKSAAENFEGCALRFSANSTVFGYGNPQAEVMIIGEAPGADEDREGKPFVGRSGQLLTKMLAAINLRRDDCFITNILLWRPPGNRTPTDSEVAVCLPFLRRQIELVKPKVIFLLGASAANALLNNSESISSLRGRILEYADNSGKIISCIASYHPAYLLRSAAQKAKSWSDLLRLRRFLEGN